MYATQLDAHQRFAFIKKLTKIDLQITCHVIKIFIIFLSFYKYDLHKYMKKTKTKDINFKYRIYLFIMQTLHFLYR